MITTMWGTIAVLVGCLILFFLGAYCVWQAVMGLKWFMDGKEPKFLIGAILYLASAAIVVLLFLEILL